MTFEKYIAEVKTGKFKIAGGAHTHTDLIEGFVYLNPKDIDAVTAEAFNQQVFSSGDDWGKARGRISAALG
jgi:hypothetical protein